MTAATDTVTIERAEFEAMITDLEALADFADTVYGGNHVDSFIWNRAMDVQRRALVAAGYRVYPDDDPFVSDLDVVCARRDALLEQYKAGLATSFDA